MMIDSMVDVCAVRDMGYSRTHRRLSSSPFFLSAASSSFLGAVLSSFDDYLFSSLMACVVSIIK